MSKGLGKQLALLRFIPILLLVVIAFGLEFVFGVPRIWAAVSGLIAAIALRLYLVRVIK
jgi:membrane associated rhomboid family serine protease